MSHALSVHVCPRRQELTPKNCPGNNAPEVKGPFVREPLSQFPQALCTWAFLLALCAFFLVNWKLAL